MAEPTEELTNAANRRACIRDGFANLSKIDDQLAAAIEEHIKPIKDARKKILKGLSTDTGIHTTDLTLDYKKFRRQEVSKTFEEEHERDAVLDAQREIYEALREGETMDFFRVSEKADEKRGGVFTAPSGPANDRPQDDTDDGLAGADPRTSSLLTKERGEGAAAYDAGKNLDDSPYDGGSGPYLAWQVGWYRREGAAGFQNSLALKDCPYPKNSEAAKDWRHGWQTESKAAEFEGGPSKDAPSTAGDELDDELDTTQAAG